MLTWLKKVCLPPIIVVFMISITAMPQPAVGTEPPLTALVIVPLTGPVAAYGEAIKNGWSLALEDIGESSFGCEVTIEDSAYKTSQALSAFQKGVASGADLAYVFGGPMGEALAPVAEQRKIPLVTDSIDPHITLGRTYVSRYANTNVELGTPLVNYLVQHGITSVVLANAENQYINTLVNGFAEAATDRLTIRRAAQVQPDETDLRGVVPRILSTKADAYGLFFMPGQQGPVARMMKASLHNALLFGGDFLDDGSEIAASDGVLEGAIFPNNVVDERFRVRYLARFRSSAHIKFAAEGYDVATMLHRDVCRHGHTRSAKEIRDRLYTPRSFDGVQGRTDFIQNENGDRYFRTTVGLFAASEQGSRLLESFAQP